MALNCTGTNDQLNGGSTTGAGVRTDTNAFAQGCRGFARFNVGFWLGTGYIQQCSGSGSFVGGFYNSGGEAVECSGVSSGGGPAYRAGALSMNINCSCVMKGDAIAVQVDGDGALFYGGAYYTVYPNPAGHIFSLTNASAVGAGARFVNVTAATRDAGANIINAVNANTHCYYGGIVAQLATVLANAKCDSGPRGCSGCTRKYFRYHKSWPFSTFSAPSSNP